MYLLIVMFSFHRVFEEIQKIEDNEFHYQEQVLEFKFFLHVICEQFGTSVPIVSPYGSATGVLIVPLCHVHLY